MQRRWPWVAVRTAYCCRPAVLSASMRSGLTSLGLVAAADDGRDGLPLLGRCGMGGLLPLLGRCGSACVIAWPLRWRVRGRWTQV